MFIQPTMASEFADVTPEVLPSNPIEFDGIYRFEEEADITPSGLVFGDRSENNDHEDNYKFRKDERVAVRFEGNNAVLSLLLAKDEEGGIPNEIIVPRDQLSSLGLKLEGYGGFAELKANFSPYPETEVAANGYYGCLGYVMGQLGFGRVGKIGHGKGMTRFLKRRHWQKVSCSNPKPGDVASWGGGRRDKKGVLMGHTAIWKNGCWQDDQRCGDPGSSYRLIECVRRPGARVAKEKPARNTPKTKSVIRKPAPKPVRKKKTIVAEPTNRR